MALLSSAFQPQQSDGVTHLLGSDSLRRSKVTNSLATLHNHLNKSKFTLEEPSTQVCDPSGFKA